MPQGKLPGVSLFILHYNDFESSANCLKAMYSHLPEYDGPWELFLIDNGSSDDSVARLKKQFPKLSVIRYDDPKQVGKSFVPAARDYAKFPLIYITPNDMEPGEGFLEPLVGRFSDKEVFAANPAALSPEGKLDYGRNIAQRRFGLFSMRRGEGDDPEKQPAAYSFSPAILGVFDKEKFLSLGGPDPLYHPTFYDDYDLGYCAWKRGWKIVYEPKARVTHRHKGQLKKTFGEREAMLIDRRNRHLFIWKNYDNVSLLFYALYIPFILFFGTLRVGPDYLRSFFAAVGKAKDAFGKRSEEEKQRKFSDSEIFRMSLGAP